MLIALEGICNNRAFGYVIIFKISTTLSSHSSTERQSRGSDDLHQKPVCDARFKHSDWLTKILVQPITMFQTSWA